jgi:threonine/homoserine/homoserine lactone efflux protein
VFGPLALGFSLGAAPGPVQVLILSQTARRGLAGGIRVMLGANLTLLAILVALALGLSAAEPSDEVLRALRVVGGAFLVGIGANEIRLSRAGGSGQPERVQRFPSLGPTTVGIVAVILNPGAWLFVATTASSVLATASATDGTVAAVIAAFAIAIGVSASDFTFSLLGSGGRRVIGSRALHVLRMVLAIALVAIGAGFVVSGVAA